MKNSKDCPAKAPKYVFTIEQSAGKIKVFVTTGLQDYSTGKGQRNKTAGNPCNTRCGRNDGRLQSVK